MNWYEKRIKELGYKGCRNCIYQIEPLRACKWLEQGGDGTVHLICPRWEMRGEANDSVRTPTSNRKQDAPMDIPAQQE